MGGDEAANNEDQDNVDLTEEQVSVIEDTITSIPENGWLDKYLSEVQDMVKDQDSAKGQPENYSQGKYYWIIPGNASLVLQGTLDPTTLYLPKVFIWLPHRLLKKKLTCPTCKAEISSSEWVKKTKARRIIDEEK